MYCGVKYSSFKFCSRETYFMVAALQMIVELLKLNFAAGRGQLQVSATDKLKPQELQVWCSHLISQENLCCMECYVALPCFSHSGIITCSLPDKCIPHCHMLFLLRSMWMLFSHQCWGVSHAEICMHLWYCLGMLPVICWRVFLFIMCITGSTQTNCQAL